MPIFINFHVYFMTSQTYFYNLFNFLYNYVVRLVTIGRISDQMTRLLDQVNVSPDLVTMNLSYSLQLWYSWFFFFLFKKKKNIYSTFYQPKLIFCYHG